MNKNILITGTTGFLSRNLINYLKMKNLNVFSTSKNLKGKNIFYFDLNNNIDKNITFLNKIDLLIHCSYYRNSSFENERKVNLVGSKKIFSFAKENNIKIIYISSLSAYEKSISNYGKIKFEIEVVAQRYNALIIRPGLIYSQNDLGGIFGSIVKLIRTFPIIPVIFDKKNFQYMCKLDSLCELIYKLIKRKNFKTPIILAANPTPLLFKELTYIIMKNYKLKRIFLPLSPKLIFNILKLIEFFRIKLNIKSDSLVSFLNPNTDLNLSKFNEHASLFPNFRLDFLLVSNKKKPNSI